MKRMHTFSLLSASLVLLYILVNLCSCDQVNLYLPNTSCKKHKLVWMYNGSKHWQECSICHHSTEKKDHDTSGNNYEVDGDIHSLVCDVCGCAVNWEDHTYNQTHDKDNHWNYCIWCGHKDDIEAHDFGGDDICDDCKYDKSKPVDSGFGITEVAFEPECQITSSYRITDTDKFYFKLTSKKSEPKAQPTTIEWVVYYKDDNLKDCILDEDSTNSYEYTFSADKSSAEYQNYKNKTLFVMCTYSNDYGTSSNSSWIGGWDI